MRTRTRVRPESAADRLRIGLGESWSRRPVVGYSAGMRRRLALAVAWASEPDVLLLDEPTNGLDPSGVRDLVDELVRFAAGGGTAVVAFHDATDIEPICDRLVVLDDGRIHATATDAVRRRTRVRLRESDCIATAAAALADREPCIEGPHVLTVDGDGQEVNRLLVRAGIYASGLSAGLRRLTRRKAPGQDGGAPCVWP